MRISPRTLPVAIAVLVVARPLAADTIKLKSGAKIEGKVLSETATEVVIEYNETASIVDRKTVKRAEIESITKETPDIAAWAALKSLRPGPNSRPADQYDAPLFQLRSFVSAYPQSAHLEEAKKNLAALEEEKKRVEGGEVKVSDRWLTTEEAEKERYQLNGLIAFNHMKTQAAGGDLMGALNTFALLEKSYGGSASFPDAVELAARLLPTVKATVERAHQNLKTEALGRQQAGASTRADLEAAAKREEDAGAASVAAAEKAGLKWPPLNIRSSISLAKIAEKVGQETTRLAGLPVAKMRQSIAAGEEAKAALAKGELEAAEAALNGAKVWDANELAKRLTTELAAAKTAAMEASKTAPPAPASEPPPAPAPAPATPAPAPAPAPAAPVAAQPEAEPAKSFFMTTPGIAAIVGGIAAVLIVLRVLASKRNREDVE